MKEYFVYILMNNAASMYVGVTNDLIRRMYEHRNGLADGFTKKYKLHRLVYFESTPDINAAIAREKQLKWWRRQWKLDLISKQNPRFEDLQLRILGSMPEDDSE